MMDERWKDCFTPHSAIFIRANHILGLEFAWTALGVMIEYKRVEGGLNITMWVNFLIQADKSPISLPTSKNCNNFSGLVNNTLHIQVMRWKMIQLTGDALTLEELRVQVSERMDYYNYERRHSSIAYQAPVVFIASLCHGRNITIPMG